MHKEGLEDALRVVEDPVRDRQRLDDILGWDPAFANVSLAWPQLDWPLSSCVTRASFSGGRSSCTRRSCFFSALRKQL